MPICSISNRLPTVLLRSIDYLLKTCKFLVVLLNGVRLSERLKLISGTVVSPTNSKLEAVRLAAIEAVMVAMGLKTAFYHCLVNTIWIRILKLCKTKIAPLQELRPSSHRQLQRSLSGPERVLPPRAMTLSGTVLASVHPS